MNARFAALVAHIKAQRVVSTLAILLTLTVGILIGTVLSRSGVKGNSTPAADATFLPMQSPQQLSDTFRQIAKQLEPAVVNINSDSTPKTPRRRLRRPGAVARHGGRVLVAVGQAHPGRRDPRGPAPGAR